MVGPVSNSDRLTRDDFSLLSTEELERITTNATGEYTSQARAEAARHLFPRSRVRVIIPRQNVGHFVMPDFCGVCSARPVTGSVSVTKSQFRIKIPLCAKCTAPRKQVAEASLNPLMISVACLYAAAVVAMLVAVVRAAFHHASGIWIAVFAVPAVTGLVILKIMVRRIVRSLPAEQQLLYARVKHPIIVLHKEDDIELWFMNATFAAEFCKLNMHLLEPSKE